MKHFSQKCFVFEIFHRSETFSSACINHNFSTLVPILFINIFLITIDTTNPFKELKIPTIYLTNNILNFDLKKLL